MACESISRSLNSGTGGLHFFVLNMFDNLDNRPAQTQNEPATTNHQSEELQILQKTQLCGATLTVYGSPAEPYFLAKEVAEVLDHSKASVMVDMVDDDEKLRETIFTSGQRREMWFLSEYGLYEVLMQSRKPIARRFKVGVKQLLHNIRTGATTENHLSRSFIRKTERLLQSAEDRIDSLTAKLKEQAAELAEYKAKEAELAVYMAEEDKSVGYYRAYRYEGFAEWRELMLEMLRPEDKQRVAREGGWTMSHVYRVLSGVTVSTPVVNALTAVARENNDKGIRSWMSDKVFRPPYMPNLFETSDHLMLPTANLQHA